MPVTTLSRRRFAGALGAAAGAALLDSIAPDASAGPDPGAPIRISANENPYGPSKKALAAMTRSQELAARYPDAAMRQVREDIAQFHGVGSDRVVLGCGSVEVLRLADAAFLSLGSTVVVAEPTFEAVLDHARVTRAEAVKVPLTKDHRHDLPEMLKACDARTGLVYVCNPNNPTGTIVSGDDLEAFVAEVPQPATILVDEAYHELVEDPSHRSMVGLIERFPNLMVTRTFSKIYGMAGMRLGYGISSEANAAKLRDHAAWSNVNVAVALAGVASLEDQAYAQRMRILLNGTRERLCSELKKDGRRYIPSHTNFVMIDVGGDVGPVVEGFREQGIRVGRRFPAMPNWLRVSIGTPEEMTAFLATLRELVPAPAAAA